VRAFCARAPGGRLRCLASPNRSVTLRCVLDQSFCEMLLSVCHGPQPTKEAIDPRVSMIRSEPPHRATALTIPIDGCAPVPVRPNSDHRGCLFEIFREEWPGAFKTVQWNACASRAGVMRGVHVHVDYDEFYTLPMGRVFLALRDIRRDSPTFGASAGFEWSSADGFAVPVPAGVAHAVFFVTDSVLVFGLSGYWKAELDIVGCRWEDLDPTLSWPAEAAVVSGRDSASGSFAEMVVQYEKLSASLAGTAVAGRV
jgi:dTDP-4-dehydrorhamnose 3,5-epimerase